MNMMELGRKRASEIELCKSPAVRTESVVFDESGNFLIYASMTGIKCVNIVTNKCSRIIGKVWFHLNVCLVCGVWSTH